MRDFVGIINAGISLLQLPVCSREAIATGTFQRMRDTSGGRFLTLKGRHFSAHGVARQYAAGQHARHTDKLRQIEAKLAHRLAGFAAGKRLGGISILNTAELNPFDIFIAISK